jgi:hypothetical protein
MLSVVIALANEGKLGGVRWSPIIAHVACHWPFLTMDTPSTLTQLVTQEDFITYRHCKSFKSYSNVADVKKGKR